MITYTGGFVNKVFLLFLFLAGCSQFHYSMKTNSFDFEKKDTKTLGNVESSYGLHSTLKFSEGVYIRILPYSPYIKSDLFCSKNNNIFNFLIWSKYDLSIDLKNTRILTKNLKSNISTVRDLNKRESAKFSDAWHVSANIKESVDLELLKKEGSLNSGKWYKRKQFYQVQFDKELGCPEEGFKLKLSFENEKNNKKITENLFFNLIKYESVSR